MPGQRASSAFWKTIVVAGAAVGACTWVLIAAALAQDSQQQNHDASAADGNPPAVSTPHPGSQPGFIHELGRWLEEGASRLKTGIGSARDRLDQLGSEARDAVKDVAGAAPSWPTTLSARERCLAAPNGAPDCQSAAETLCRGKGFTAGRILDTQTEQKCPGRLLLSGRAPNKNDCSTEIFVTRAICQ
jgi:hypothetical protein